MRGRGEIRFTEEEAKAVESLKKEGIGVSDIFRAGLSQYLNKAVLKPEIIKTKEQAEVKVAKLGKDSGLGVYGCGCAKEPGKVFCAKHKRM